MKLKSRSGASGLSIFLVAALGCHGTPGDVGRSLPLAADPCAERLHDICGQFLLYYSSRGELPEKLEDLSSAPGSDEPPSFTCPISQKPYVYDRGGLPISEPPGRVVLYDFAPVHSGLRWAIVIVQSGGGRPLMTRIVGIGEEKWAQVKVGTPPR